MPENRGQQVIQLGPWMGLWSRSGDGPPADHLYICDNAMFTDEIVHSRPGFSQLFAKNNIVRAVPFKLSSGPVQGRWLLLVNPSGVNYEIYDSVFSLVTPIWTFSVGGGGTVDMSVSVIYDRAYISIHNRVTAIVGQHVIVWDPSVMSVAREAAGLAPTGTFTVGVSGTNGNVEPGLHIYAVAFETNTGHVTKPALYVSLTSPSGTKKKVDLSVIPLGPTGTTARWILASKVVFNFDGNLEHPKLFFAKKIEDNTTTALTGANGLDFYDTQLVSDADYLKDIYTQIPAGVASCVYASRFCLGNILVETVITGPPGGPIITIKAERSMLIASVQNQIESFSKVSGFQIIAKSEGGGIKQLSEVNGLLYARKSFMTFATQDNGLDPAKWPVNAVDIATGTECYGVASFPGTSAGSYKGLQLVCDRSGLSTFDGVYPVRALSWKIETDWQAFNPANYAAIQVAVDPERQIVYVLKPQATPTGNFAEIYVGDCNRGLDPDNIRWSRWVLEADVRSIFVDYVNSLIPVLVIQVGGTTNAGMYQLNDLASLINAPSTTFFSGINLQEKFQIALGRVPMHPNGATGQAIQLLARGMTFGPSSQTTTIRPIFWPHRTNLLIGGTNFADVVIPFGYTLPPSRMDFSSVLSKGMPFENDFAYIIFEQRTDDRNWCLTNLWLYFKPRSDEVPQ